MVAIAGRTAGLSVTKACCLRQEQRRQRRSGKRPDRHHPGLLDALLMAHAYARTRVGAGRRAGASPPIPRRTPRPAPTSVATDSCRCSRMPMRPERRSLASCARGSGGSTTSAIRPRWATRARRSQPSVSRRSRSCYALTAPALAPATSCWSVPRRAEPYSVGYQLNGTVRSGILQIPAEQDWVCSFDQDGVERPQRAGLRDHCPARARRLASRVRDDHSPANAQPRSATLLHRSHGYRSMRSSPMRRVISLRSSVTTELEPDSRGSSATRTPAWGANPFRTFATTTSGTRSSHSRTT